MRNTIIFNQSTGEFDYSTSYDALDEFEVYSDSHEHVHSEWFIHVYSALAGAMPDDDNVVYETSYGNFPLSAADKNNDNFITLDEAHQRADEFDSKQEIFPWGSGGLGDDPQLSDQGYLGKTTSLEHPTLLSSDVDYSATFNGEVTVLNHVHILPGHTLILGSNSKIIHSANSSITIDAGANLVINDNVQISNLNTNNISNYGNININGNNNLSSVITTKSGGVITLESSKTLNLTSNGKIIVESGGMLVINNNYTFRGAGTGNTITVNGNVQIGTGVTFTTNTGSTFGGLALNSNSLTLNIDNCNFTGAKLTGNSQSLNITNCEFENSQLAYTRGNLTVQNSNFENTKIWATSALSTSEVQINNCEVSGYNYSAIYINSYRKFTIEDCDIHDNGYNGIYVYNAGINGGLIKGNTITDNGTGNHAGIRIYNSYASVELNYIAENRYGIMCLNGSNTDIKGNQSANYPYQTQQIINNDINQLYTSSTSFPDFIRYNSILKNNSNYKVYYDGTPSSNLDVSWNFWGRRINPQADLYPAASYYTYFPPWFFLFPMPVMSTAEKLYTEGLEEKGKANFDNSQKKFQKVIEKYPGSAYALHSLKELMAVEVINKENYQDLKGYLLTEKKIQQNKKLKKLAGRLANNCDIKLKNYPQAINWFENVIENPETLEDSVFAIIDLGYTYFLMGNTKSAYTGQRAEFKYKSVQKFEKKREELIDLLFMQETNNTATGNTEIEEQESTEMDLFELNSETNFKIFPNPFKHESQILYSLSKSAQVLIRVFDYSGKEIKTLVNTHLDKGSYQQTFNSENLNPGIYFYSVELNGKTVKTDKMIIIE